MLAMQRHLASCASCAAEAGQVREVRRLLRSLSTVAPGGPLEARISQRVAGSKCGVRFGTAADALARPQRGRRLAGALALSSAALLMLAAPFAPSTGDAVRAGTAPPAGVMEAGLPQGSLPNASSAFSPWEGAGTGRLVPPAGMAGPPAAWGGPGRTPSAGASVTLSGWSAAPLDDEAVEGYAAGDAAPTDADGH